MCADRPLLTFDLLPRDVLTREIRRYLDVTSLRQWRRTERAIGLFLAAPRPTVRQWELVAQHTAATQFYRSKPESVFPAQMTAFMRRLDQAIHDDHVGVLNHEWPKFARWVTGTKIASEAERWDAWRHVLYVALSAGAQIAWSRITLALWMYTHGKELRIYDFGDLRTWGGHRIDVDDLTCYAIGHGQWAFVRQVFHLDDDVLCRLVINDRPPRRDRYNGQARPSCIASLFKHHHFEDVHKVEAYFLLKDGGHALVVIKQDLARGALRHGDADLVRGYAPFYQYSHVCETLLYGTSAAGLEALEQMRPDLLIQLRRAPKRAKLAAAACKSGASVHILEWLLNKGYLPNTLATFGKITYSAANKFHWRTLQWVQRRLSALKAADPDMELPAWTRDPELFEEVFKYSLD
jgi:hypothetical protein